MARSEAGTVKEYLEELPPERREVVAKVRRLVNDNLPRGYRETMGSGMICWGIPLSRYPDTYNGQPLCYAALAAQKNGYSLYLLAAYMGADRGKLLDEGYRKAGKKLDMGKSCLRFKKLDDLVPGAIAKVIASMPPEAYIEAYEATRPKKERKATVGR